MSPLCSPSAWTNPPAIEASATPRSQQSRQPNGVRWVIGCYELQNVAPTPKACDAIPVAPAVESAAHASTQGWDAFGALFAQAQAESTDVADQFLPTVAANVLDEDAMLVDPSLTWERMAEIGNCEPRTSAFVRHFDHEV